MDTRKSLKLLAAYKKYQDLMKYAAQIDKSEKSKKKLGKALAIVISNDFESAETKKDNVVRALLAAGADVSEVHPITNQGCMHIAIDNAIKNKIENNIIDLLLEHRASLGVKNQNRNSPIKHLLDNHDNKTGWKLLVKIVNKIKPVSTDEEKNMQLSSALIKAVDAERLEEATLLIEAGAARYSHINGNYALHVAVKNKDFQMLELLCKNKFDIHELNEAKLIPLELAASLGYWKGVDLFLDPEFKFKEKNQGHAALRSAVAAGRYLIAEKLIKSGATISEADKLANNGETCLHLAAGINASSTISTLINNGASASAVDIYDKTPIELACKKNNWTAAESLIKNQSGADPLLLHYKPALLSAIEGGNHHITQLLLANKAPCSECDERGNIALYQAITHQHEETPQIIRELLQAGANPEMLEKGTRTMFEVAKLFVKKDAIQATKCYDALLKYSNSNLMPILRKKDFLNDLLNEINENMKVNYFRKMSGLIFGINGLPDFANQIYDTLKAMNTKESVSDINHQLHIQQVFQTVFDILEKANTNAKVSRLPEMNIWYKEKLKAIKEVTALCDSVGLTQSIRGFNLSAAPPSYQQHISHSTISNEIMLMNRFLFVLSGVIRSNQFNISENNNLVNLKPDQSLIDALKKILQEKKEEDPNSIRNAFDNIVQMLNVPHETVFVKENAETKKWREFMRDQANTVIVTIEMQMTQTMQTIHQNANSVSQMTNSAYYVTVPFSQCQLEESARSVASTGSSMFTLYGSPSMPSGPPVYSPRASTPQLAPTFNRSGTD